MNEPFAAIALPALPNKPRSSGVTAVLDKGLGAAKLADLLELSGNWIDVAKLGWATARLYPRDVLEKKLATYAKAAVAACTGGTFLEVALAQNRVDEMLSEAKNVGFTMVEVSNGVHPMSQEEKLDLIEIARATGLTVWSEVGKKDPEEDARLTLSDRIEAVREELDHGASKVILEARESGTLGIYDRGGKPLAELLNRLAETFGIERLVFEAPRKDQQVWMIRNFGPKVNLGNIVPDDALSVATLRTGLRGDTFRDVQLSGIDVFVEVGVNGALLARQRGGVVILVDALRASATIVAALASGMAAVRPVANPEECVGEVTAGERGGRKLPHLDHGNSPTELLRHDYAEKTLVLTSSNGVECLLTAATSDTRLLVGSTINRTAVARAATDLARREGRSITLLMAGRNNRPTVEDALAASEILHQMKGVRLHGDSLPSAKALEAEFFASESGRNLVELGYSDDVQFCSRVDLYQVVPVFDNGLLTRMS